MRQSTTTDLAFVILTFILYNPYRESVVIDKLRTSNKTYGSSRFHSEQSEESGFRKPPNHLLASDRLGGYMQVFSGALGCTLFLILLLYSPK